MEVLRAAVGVQRWAGLGAVALSAVLILPESAVDPFVVVKFTVVVLGALVAAAAMATRLAGRTLAVPRPSTLAVTGAFALAAVVATVTSSRPVTSLIGEYSSYAGLASQLAYVVVLLAVVTAADHRFLRQLGATIVVTAGLVSLYGIVQMVGADPYEWGGTTRVITTMGNPNFTAGWLGATFPLCLAVVLTKRVHVGWRVVAALVAGASGLVILASESFQGPVAALGGSLLVIGIAVATRWRRAVIPAVIAMLAAFALAAPFALGEVEESMRERVLMWQGAAELAAENPVVGTGLDTFALHFLAIRPAEHAIRYGFVNPEQPHNLLLAKFSNGGILLGAAYLAVLVVVAAGLVRALRVLAPEDRPLAAAFGGLWIGWLFQSLVSLDLPQLTVLGWAGAGAILSLTRPSILPALGPVTPGPKRRGKGARKRPAPKGPTARPGTAPNATAAVAAVVVLVVGWLATRPLRADLAAADAIALGAAGRVPDAVAQLEHATDLVGRSRYWLMAVSIHRQTEQLDEAQQAAIRAATADSGSARQALLVAEIAAERGDTALATEWYREAVDRDPNHPAVLRQAADHLASAGEEEAAAQLRDRADALESSVDT